MAEQASRYVSCMGLVVGAALGLAGTFAPTVAVRGLLWGIDGTALVVAASLLTVHYARRGNDLLAAGFLVFVAGEALILSTSAMDLQAGGPVFGAGTGLWAASLALLSAPRVAPLWVRLAGAVASLLFLAVALQSFAGGGLTALSQPLPFFAYPFLVAALVGWAWERHRGGDWNSPR